MNTFETIINRRSIRKYLRKKIDAKLLHRIVCAGMYAPSARNEQPWHFILVDDRDVLDEIVEIHPYAQMLKRAPAAIIVCGDKTLETAKDYWSIDCAAATQNILLMATELGIGSCWLGVYPRKERILGFRRMLKLPKHIIPFCVIALGYSDEIKTIPEDRIKLERIKINKW